MIGGDRPFDERLVRKKIAGRQEAIGNLEYGHR
jgi:hypothetical protein